MECWRRKAANISETCKDRGHVTMEDLYEFTHALTNGTSSDPLQPPLPQDWCLHPTPNFNRYYLKNGQSDGLQIWQVHSQGPSEQNPRNRARFSWWEALGPAYNYESICVTTVFP